MAHHSRNIALFFLLLTHTILLPEKRSNESINNQILSYNINPGDYFSLWANFYPVDPGKLYRSAQLTPRWFSYYIKRYNIKSVINLRGKHPEKQWWQEEAQLFKELGIHFRNIRMSATKMTSKKKLMKLLDYYNSLPRPILIHCQAGADRTGEAAALWKLEQENQSPQKALDQLTLTYWHITQRHPAKRFLISIWQGRRWLEESYESNLFPPFPSAD